MTFHGAQETIGDTAGVCSFPAVSAGDFAFAIYTTDGTGNALTRTGWSEPTNGNGDLSGPDGQTVRILKMDAACTGSETTVQFTGQTQHSVVIIVTVSGRDTNSPITFCTNTQSTASNATPMSISATGGTAAAGDDLFLLAGFDPTASGDHLYALSSVTTGFAKAKEANTTTWSSLAVWYKENVSAGATGSITATATSSDGTTPAGWSAFGIALKSSAPTGPTIDTQPSAATVFAGQLATFTIAATASGGSNSYQWKKNGSNVGTNSTTYSFETSFADNGARISCDVTDSNGTTSSVTVTLTVLYGVRAFKFRA